MAQTSELPAGYTQRPLTMSDLPAVIDIAWENERLEPTGELPDAESWSEYVQGPMVDLARRSVGVFHSDDLVGYGICAVLSDASTWASYTDGGVRTAHTRRGVGRFIQQRLEQMARDQHRADGAVQEGEIRFSVPSSRVGTAALAQELGYKSWRYFYTLQRDLHDPIAAPGDVPGLIVRPYTDADAEPTRLSRNSAFADHWGSLETSLERWQSNLIGSSAFRPAHSFVAEFAGEPERGIAGFAMAEEFAADFDEHGYRVAYIALIGSVREARGRGLASALLTHQLGSLAEGGFRMAELNVDSASPTGAGRIYERAGFVQKWTTETRGKKIPTAHSD